MTDTPSLFSIDPGKIFDFSKMSPAEVFNQSVVPRANSFAADEDPGGLDEARARREKQLQSDMAREAYASNADDAFLRDVYAQKSQPMFDSVPETDYNSPVSSGETPVRSVEGFIPAKLKLSNYGYASDSSPDTNSNVKRIGHANNPLVSGVSAALTKSLAQKHGLKTGDEFEVITSDGKVLKRRYDDTVPSTYKGKPLPETVDLFNTEGSNSFGGTIVGIRPIPKSK